MVLPSSAIVSHFNCFYLRSIEIIGYRHIKRRTATRHPGHMKALFFVMNDFSLWSGDFSLYQSANPMAVALMTDWHQ